MEWSDFVGSVFDTGASALDIWTKQQLGVEVAEKTGVDDTPATAAGVPAPVSNVPAGYGVESIDMSTRKVLIYGGLALLGTIVLIKVL